jgi:hypothetical protein
LLTLPIAGQLRHGRGAQGADPLDVALADELGHLLPQIASVGADAGEEKKAERHDRKQPGTIHGAPPAWTETTDEA